MERHCLRGEQLDGFFSDFPLLHARIFSLLTIWPMIYLSLMSSISYVKDEASIWRLGLNGIINMA